MAISLEYYLGMAMFKNRLPTRSFSENGLQF